MCPRRDTAFYLKEHEVLLNGRRVVELNTYVPESSLAKITLYIDGKRISIKNSSQVVLLHKPRGVVCSHRRQKIRGKELPIVFDFLPREYAHWFFAGRLDVSSEGLVVLSDDGDHIYALTHPSGGMLKKYYLRTNRPLSEAERARCISGIIDKNEKLCFARIESAALPAEYFVWLREGRNREIRRVMERLGVQVRRLVRLEMGPYSLGSLAPGKWILHPKEAIAHRTAPPC